MTRTRTLLMTAATGAFLLAGAPVAHAAPGDPIPPVIPDGCVLYGQPPNQEVRCAPETPPVITSVCTPIDNSEVAPLLRKSCQQYADGVPLGDPQIYIYPPDRTDSASTPPSTPPATTTVAPRTTSAPSTRTSAAAPIVRTVPGPTHTRTETQTVEVAAPVADTTIPSLTPPPTQDRHPGPDVSGIGTHGVEQSVTDGMLYGIAAVAALVLLGAILIPRIARRYRAGSHRAG